MPSHDADLRARLLALSTAPKTLVVKLTRVRQGGDADPQRTLHFTFDGFTKRSSRSRTSFITPDRVPPFESDEGWFEVEEVKAKPWSYWRAVRQVEPPANART